MSAQRNPCTKLTDLSPDLQARILSFLTAQDSTEQRAPPVKISLDGVYTVSTPLPHDLLSVAQASTALAAATAHVLGPRARFLTGEVAMGRLPQWVAALAPFVRAVSTLSLLSMEQVEPQVVESVHSEEVDAGEGEAMRAEEAAEPTPWQLAQSAGVAMVVPSTQLPFAHGMAVTGPGVEQFLPSLGETVVQLLKSLSGHKFSVEVLDLKDVPFDGWKKREEELLTGLVSALGRSGASLRELSLPVTGLCASALSRVTLRNLNLMELSLGDLWQSRGISVNEKGRAVELFMRMLQALDGHADRSTKLNKLHELRLMSINKAPFLDTAQSGCTPGFFSAVKTLRLFLHECDVHEHDSIATFVSLFPKLERLHWNGFVTPKHLHVINRGCGNMQELHLSPEVVFNPASDDLPEDGQVGDASTLGAIFAACDGKLKTLELHGKPSTEQMKVLGERNPDLQNVAMEIGAESVGGLALLLGSHCRRIRKLELTVLPDDEEDEGLGIEGWRLFTEAVCSASDELCEVAIGLDEGIVATESSIQPVLRSMQDVLEFLGERARKVKFSASSDGEEEFNVLVNGLCRIMRTCYALTKNLTCLEASFNADDMCSEDVGAQEKELYEQLLMEKKKLLEELPHLQSFSLGGTDGDVEYRLDQMGT